MIESLPDRLVDRVLRFVRSGNLLQPGPLVVAVSGGQDSVCMLHILRSIAPALALDLHVAHLNHNFRGAQAEEEAGFVQTLAAAWGLPLEAGAIDVPAYRARHRLSKQVAARYARYQFLTRVASCSGSDRVAVGHTADDSAETLLLNLLRGAGLAGLGGLSSIRRMQPGQLGPPLKRADWLTPELPADVDRLPWVVRPIISLSRSETEAYCRACGIPFRSDPSNLDPAYRRNWIRQELIPMLEKRVPSATERLSSTADLLADDWLIVGQVVDSLWGDLVSVSEGSVQIDLPGLTRLEEPLQRYLLRRAVQNVAGNLEEIARVHLDAALRVARDGQVGARVDLPGGVYLEKGYNSILLASPGRPKKRGQSLSAEGVPLPVPGRVDLPSGTIEAAVAEVDPLAVASWPVDPFEAHLDADHAGIALVVRRRRAGDRFVPLGMLGPKKLQDFLVDQKVSRADRDDIPIVATPDEIVWVAGYRIDERFRVTAETERVLILKYRGQETGGQ